MTKYEFLAQLERELTHFGVADKSEIFTDFEQHFADSLARGVSEAEAVEKLGDISEIAKQYAPDGIGDNREEHSRSDYFNQEYDSREEHSRFDSQYNRDSRSDYANSGVRVTVGKWDSADFNWTNLVVVLVVDIFVLSWAIPALFAVVVGLLSVPFALSIGGISAILGGAFIGLWENFHTPFSGLATVFLGIMFASIGGLLAIAGIQLVKLFIKVVKSVIDWHGVMLTGKPVFKKDGQVDDGDFAAAPVEAVANDGGAQ